MGHRVAVMRDGRLQQVATPHELYEHPANTFVARSVGQPGMNILQARLHDAAGVLTIRFGEIAL